MNLEHSPHAVHLKGIDALFCFIVNCPHFTFIEEISSFLSLGEG